MQRYNVTRSSKQLSDMVGLPLDALIKQADLPVGFEPGERGVTAREYFALWSATIRAIGREDVGLFFGRAFSGVPHNSETAAFLFSPDVKTGLERLALFKPLICPVRAQTETTAKGVRIRIHAADPAVPLPLDFQALHPIFILSVIRAATGKHVVPIEVGFDGPELGQTAIADFFGIAPQRAPFVSLTVSHKDAARALQTQDAEKWGWVEPQLRAKLQAMRGGQTISERVACELVEMLPAGLSGIELVCRRLQVSKRALQRSLKAEGRQFKHILSQTRRDLALGYLKMPDLTVAEISYLLGYREPNSFYRAFQGWAGMTPQQARQGFNEAGLAY